MSRKIETTRIVDGLLKFMTLGGVLGLTVLAPNALAALDKPLRMYLRKMDDTERKFEYERILRHMRRQGLIQYKTEDYEHGIALTSAGQARARKADIDKLTIRRPVKWDGDWRLVFFDIPEYLKSGRNALSARLKELGFVQLQRSVWIHPFSCRQEIEAITVAFDLTKYVTYLETSYIDAEDKLEDRFHSLLHQ